MFLAPKLILISHTQFKLRFLVQLWHSGKRPDDHQISIKPHIIKKIKTFIQNNDYFLTLVVISTSSLPKNVLKHQERNTKKSVFFCVFLDFGTLANSQITTELLKINFADYTYQVLQNKS